MGPEKKEWVKKKIWWDTFPKRDNKKITFCFWCMKPIGIENLAENLPFKSLRVSQESQKSDG